MDEIRLSSSDIGYVEKETREYPGFNYQDGDEIKYRYPQKYEKSVIHLSHDLGIDVNKPYRVVTEEFIMGGYLLSDGLTIVEY